MAQRVTNSMMVMNFNRNLNKANTQMMRYQSQLATNKRIVRLSDDPVGVTKGISARGKINDIEQYKRNIDDGLAWMTNSETALSELNEILKRSYELAVQAANDTNDLGERQAIAKEIAQLRDQVIAMANSTLGDKYIFGNYNVTEAPFSGDPETGEITFNGDVLEVYDPASFDEDSGVGRGFIHYQVGMSESLVFPVASEAAAMMGTEFASVYYGMSMFANALESPETLDGYDQYGDPYVEVEDAKFPDIQQYISALQELQKNNLALMSDIGGRVNRLEMMSSRYGQDIINYTQMQSDVEDLDQGEAIMNFSMMEAVYRAALSVGGRVLPPSLMDFLR